MGEKTKGQENMSFGLNHGFLLLQKIVLHTLLASSLVKAPLVFRSLPFSSRTRQSRMPQDDPTTMARGVNGIGGLNSRQVQIVSVTSMLIFLSTLAVALRFFSRRISTRCICMDDYVILFALVRGKTVTLDRRNLTSVSSCFHMEIASVNLWVSGSNLAANVNRMQLITAC